MASHRPSHPDAASAGHARRGAAVAARARRGRLLALGTIVAVFALFGSIVWYAWVESRALGNGELPLLRASREPYRVAPEDPGGLPIPNADRPIGRLLEGETAPRPERILPAEEPDVRTLAAQLSTDAQEERAGRSGSAVGRPGEASRLAQSGTPRPPRSLFEAPAASPGPGAVGGGRSDDAAPAAAGTPSGVGTLEPAAGGPSAGAEPETAPSARPLLPPAPSSTAVTTGEVPAAAEATSEGEVPAPDVAAVPEERESQAAPAAAEPAPVSAAEPVAEAARPAAGDGAGVRVQLAAVSRRDGIERHWAAMRRRWPEVLAGRELTIEPLERGGRTLYRIQAAGFASKQEAAAACRRIRDAGGDCFVVAR